MKELINAIEAALEHRNRRELHRGLIELLKRVNLNNQDAKDVVAYASAIAEYFDRNDPTAEICLELLAKLVKEKPEVIKPNAQASAREFNGLVAVGRDAFLLSLDEGKWDVLRQVASELFHIIVKLAEEKEDLSPFYDALGWWSSFVLRIQLRHPNMGEYFFEQLVNALQPLLQAEAVVSEVSEG